MSDRIGSSPSGHNSLEAGTEKTISIFHDAFEEIIHSQIALAVEWGRKMRVNNTPTRANC